MGACPLCDLELYDSIALDRHVEACLARAQSKSGGDNDDDEERKQSVIDEAECPVCSALVSPAQLEQHVDQCLLRSASSLENTVMGDVPSTPLTSTAAAASSASVAAAAAAAVAAVPSKKRNDYSSICDRLLDALEKGEKRGEPGVPFTVARRIIFDLFTQHKRDMDGQAEQFVTVRLELETTIRKMRQAQDNELSELRMTEWKAQDDLVEQHSKKAEEWSSAVVLKEQEVAQLRRQADDLAVQMKQLGEASSANNAATIDSLSAVSRGNMCCARLQAS
jgi:hypothetical protein